MKNKPDDRTDNVEKIQFNIDNTIKNYRETEEIISSTDDEKLKNELCEKNKRREAALNGMKEEIKDEAIDRKNKYK